DARATEMSARGEWNVGQLTRERYGENVFLIGFGTNSGTVTAASDWGGIAERKRVRAALAGSYERLFHETGEERFWIDLRARNDAVKLLRQRRLERAIGVIYRPDAEPCGPYFDACLPDEFD